MGIHGVDISRYQPPEAMDNWSFAILNVEDPGVATKIERAKTLNIPWGFYTWLYPGDGARSMQRSIDRAAQLGVPPLGHWIDYEQAGVSPADLAAALDRAEAAGVFDRVGIYTYLYIIGSVHAHLRNRPLWLAYYPSPNDGAYKPTQDYDARDWGAAIWQYSSGGNLDRNVVIDETWWAAWLGVTPTPPPEPEQRKQEPAMFMAWIHDGNWVDLWSANGVILQGWENNDSQNIYGVGERMQRFMNAGVPVVVYPSADEDTDEYVIVRKALLEK